MEPERSGCMVLFPSRSLSWLGMLAALTVASSCPLTTNVGFVSKDKNAEGAIELANLDSEGTATLATELPRTDASGSLLPSLKIREWSYQYTWVVKTESGESLRRHSGWTFLGTNLDGSPRTTLSIRPYEVPEIRKDAESGSVTSIVCKLRGEYERGPIVEPTPIPGPDPTPALARVPSSVSGEGAPLRGKPMEESDKSYMVLPIPIVIRE